VAGEGFAGLFDARHLSVVTFRRNGDEVATPVWTVELDGALYVRTDAASGKVKRLRREPHLLLAPCTFRCKLFDVSERPDVVPALDAKYGFRSRAAGFSGRLRRRTPLILELVPAAAPEPAAEPQASVPDPG
jgi:PPOX class probable F420-dependent enzyme